MIIYIHGFGSSGEASKAKLLRAYCHENNIRFIAPSLPTIPDLALSTLSELIESYQDNEPVYLMGSSLGGYYALYLSDKYNLKAVLINPAVNAPETLERALGHGVNYYDNSSYEWNESHLEILESYEIEEPNLENLLLLLQKGDELLDYDAMEKLAKEVHPKMIIGGTSAYSRIIDFERMAAVAHEVGALLMIDMAHFAGLVAGGEYPSPVPWADIVTTTTHKTLRGPRGGIIMCKEEYAKAIDKAVFPGMQGGPLEHVIAAKAVAFGEDLSPAFKEYAKQVKKNEKVLSDELQNRGVRVISGGTDTHVLLADMRAIGITGKTAQTVLDEIGITANKNTIPFETLSPFVTSGIRLGSPALTTRGLVEEDFKEIADIISTVVKNTDKDEVKKSCAERVSVLCKKYPLYNEI